MANEHDVLAAWLKICRDDTGAGSLVTLTGHSEPAVTERDPEEVDLPAIVLPAMPPSRVTGGVPKQREGTWNVEVWVGRGSLKLGHQLLDRLETITTWSAFDAEGLDVKVDPAGRSREPPGEVKGHRLMARYRLTVTV